MRAETAFCPCSLGEDSMGRTSGKRPGRAGVRGSAAAPPTSLRLLQKQRALSGTKLRRMPSHLGGLLWPEWEVLSLGHVKQWGALQKTFPPAFHPPPLDTFVWLPVKRRWATRSWSRREICSHRCSSSPFKLCKRGDDCRASQSLFLQQQILRI